MKGLFLERNKKRFVKFIIIRINTLLAIEKLAYCCPGATWPESLLTRTWKAVPPSAAELLAATPTPPDDRSSNLRLPRPISCSRVGKLLSGRLSGRVTGFSTSCCTNWFSSGNSREREETNISWQTLFCLRRVICKKVWGSRNVVQINGKKKYFL